MLCFHFQVVSQTTTVQGLTQSVVMEALSTFADAMPTKIVRLERSVTPETWTAMATTRSAFPMVAFRLTKTVLATMRFATCLTMTTVTGVTT